jgi:arylsulfatase A-like enzyme
MPNGRRCNVSQTSRRPNLVYILADQLGRNHCGFAGADIAHTPHMTRLATESVELANAVSTMPVCAAYRASLLTGKYPTSTGMVINELRMHTGHRCLGHVLTEGGYQTGYIGKWHLYANQLGNHHDPRNSHIPPGPDRLGFDGYWAAYNFHHDYHDACYHEDTPARISYGPGMYEPDAQTDMALQFLARSTADPAPFALFLSLGTPHDPWVPENVPACWYRLFADTEFPLQPNYADSLDPYGDAWSNQDKSPELINAWMRVYYAMTANLDWNLGRLLAALERMGLAQDTLVVFTSDHGEMFGGHGRMKKNTFYEEASRVPLLARWPGRLAAGSKCDACVGTVDIMPTLLGLVGMRAPDAAEGMDLSSLLLNGSGPEPEAALLQNTGACAAWEDGHEWRALRDKRYTYAVYRVDGRELLFDNLSDPCQLRDLVGSAQHQGALGRFRSLLAQRMTALNDTFPPSTWYRDRWTQDRVIRRTATMV